MIYAKPGREFEALLEDAPTGLVGTLATRIDDDGGTLVLARSITGITEPVTGNYLVKRLAPTEEANYLLVWDKDADGLEVPAEDLAVEQLQVTRILPFESVVDFLPDPVDVAALLTARTFDSSSTEIGVFTADTRPTEGQVQTLINQAGNEVGARLGKDEIETDDLRAYARELVALRAAVGVEISYFPEQVDSEQSAYEKLRELYETGLAALIAAMPDTSATKKGLYSLRMRSDVAGAGLLSTAELLP